MLRDAYFSGKLAAAQYYNGYQVPGGGVSLTGDDIANLDTRKFMAENRARAAANPRDEHSFDPFEMAANESELHEARKRMAQPGQGDFSRQTAAYPGGQPPQTTQPKAAPGVTKAHHVPGAQWPMAPKTPSPRAPAPPTHGLDPTQLRQAPSSHGGMHGALPAAPAGPQTRVAPTPSIPANRFAGGGGAPTPRPMPSQARQALARFRR